MSDWLVKGLARLLAIMAVLQLIKKLPDLINTIFGTHIQTRGGIKGRLGEMAGIGGLAQKAWTSLGNGAKNLAKIGLTAPAAIGYAAGNAAFKRKTGQNLHDTKAGRWVRGIGSGVSEGFRTGSVLKGFNKGRDSFNKTYATPADKARYLKMVNDQVNADLKDPSGRSVVNEINLENKRVAKGNVESRIRSQFGDDIADANLRQQRAVQAYSLAKSISSDNDSISSLLNQAMGRYAVGSNERSALVEALDNFEKESGRDGIANLRNFMTNNAGLFDSATWENLVGENGKITSKERKLNYAEANAAALDLTENNLTNLRGGKAAVQFLSDTTLKGRYDEAKSDFDVTVAGHNLTDTEKMALDKNVSADTDINNSIAFSVGRKYSDNGYAPSINASAIGQSPYLAFAEAEEAQRQAAIDAQRQAEEAQRQAEEQAQRQAEADRIAEERSEAAAQRQAEASRVEAVREQISVLQEQLDALNAELENAKKYGTATQISALRTQISDVQNQIIELERQL